MRCYLQFLKQLFLFIHYALESIKLFVFTIYYFTNKDYSIWIFIYLAFFKGFILVYMGF